MRAQLQHVLSLMDRDNVDVRVLPTALGPHDAPVGPFTVFDFDEARSIGYVEALNGAIYVQDQDQVRAYTRTVHRLREVALSPARTKEVIRSRLTQRT